MKRTLLLTTGAAACLVLGAGVGALSARYYSLVSDYPYVMALHRIIADNADIPPLATLELLDLYQAKVRQQINCLGSPRFWRQELVQAELRRYILLSRLSCSDAAEEALRHAAMLQERSSSPTETQVELLRKAAERVYGK